MTLLSSEELIKRTIEVYKLHWKSLLRYVLVTFLFNLFILILMGIIMLLVVGVGATVFPSWALDFNIIGPFILVVIVASFVLLILNLWLDIAITRTTSRAVLNQEKISVGAEFKNSRPLVWRMVGAFLLSGIIAIGPLFLTFFLWVGLRFSGYYLVNTSLVNILVAMFGIYGIFHFIYFAIRFCFVMIGVALHGWGVKESLQKSTEMVKGKWWAIFGRLLLLLLVLIVPYYVLTGIGTFEGFVGSFFDFLAVIYYMGILLPVGRIPLVLVYYNLKGDLPHHAPATEQK
jgi:hypothetical protein